MEQVGLQCDALCGLISVWTSHEEISPFLPLTLPVPSMQPLCSAVTAVQMYPKKPQISFDLLSQCYTVSS